MRYGKKSRALALLLALVCGLTAMGFAEELAEMDLFDPAIYASGAPAEAPEAPFGAESAGDMVIEEAAEVETFVEGDAAAMLASTVPTTLKLGKKEKYLIPVPSAYKDEVVFVSSKPKTVSVGVYTGLLTAKKTGTATIAICKKKNYANIASVPDSDILFKGKVTVVKAPSSVKFTKSKLNLSLDDSAQLKVKLSSGSASQIAYKSSKPSVATVDAKGVVTALKAGTATITATTFNKKKATCKVTVKNTKEPKSLELNATAISVGVKEKFTLVPEITDGTTTTFTFTSANKKIATVSKKGVVTGVKAGSTTVTVKTANGLKATCKVTVTKASSAANVTVTLTPAKLPLFVGASAQLTAKLEGGTSLITWTTDNADVATVDQNGMVTAYRVGTATINAAPVKGTAGTCVVTVTSRPTATPEGTIDPSASPTATPEGTLDPSASPTATPEGTVDPSASPTATPDGTLDPSASPTAEPTATPTPTPTPTPEPTKTPLPTPPSDQPIIYGDINEEEFTTIPLGETHALDGWVKAYNGSQLGYVSIWVTKPDSTVTRIIADGVKGMDFVTLQDEACENKFVIDTSKEPYNKQGIYRLELYATYHDEGRESSFLEYLDSLVLIVTEPKVVTPAMMISNLKVSDSVNLGAKKNAIISMVQTLLDNGFEPAFAAGLAANLYAEGNYGVFETSKYDTFPHRRPRYMAYLDGGNIYTEDVTGGYIVTEVYLSKTDYLNYTGTLIKHERYADENYYKNNFSDKKITAFKLSIVESLLNDLASDGWEGEFGLGVMQWRRSEAQALVKLYKEAAGSSDSITEAKVIEVENKMILSDLKGSHVAVYNTWKSANEGSLASETAAGSAGTIVCNQYESSASDEATVEGRTDMAMKIYNVMMGK